MNIEELYSIVIISVARRRKQFSNSLFKSINALATTSTISGRKPLEYRITPYPNTKKYSRKTKKPLKNAFPDFLQNYPLIFTERITILYTMLYTILVLKTFKY